MKKNYDVAVFHGDGIGPEIMAPTLEILRQLSGENPSYELAFSDAPAGASHYARNWRIVSSGSHLKRRATPMRFCCLRWVCRMFAIPDGTEISPQIDLRKQLGLFAGVRPVR